MSEDVAARLWPGEDPIGKRLKFGGLEFDSPWRTIVGVARPTRYRELREARPTLAAIGLYAVMAAYVRQRYTEIGVRVALGATASDVRSLVLGEGLRLAGLGAATGLAIAVMAIRLLRGLLFEVHPLDPMVMLVTALLVMSASALASYLPARRAMRVDPMALLRAD